MPGVNFNPLEENEKEFGVWWRPHPATDLRLVYLDDTDDVSRLQAARGERKLIRTSMGPWFLAGSLVE